MSELVGGVSKIESKCSKKSDKFLCCDKRCVMHQEDRTCFTDTENKDIIKTFPEEASSETSFDADDDSLHSGESLFKTFKFDPKEQNPDMEKCMNFWKGLLATNAKPIKCTLMKTEKKKEKTPKKEVVKEKSPIDDEEVKNMWLGIYKDLQKRNLDKIQLVRNKICDPCVDYVDEKYEKKQEQEDIKKLNDWKSKTQPMRTKIDIRAQIQRTTNALHSLRTGSKSSALGQEISDVPSSQKPHRRKAPSTSVLTTPKTPKKTHSSSELLTPVSDTEGHSTSKIQQQTVKSPEVIAKPDMTSTKNKSDQMIPEVQEKTPEQMSKTNVATSSACCNCGCSIDDCVCTELDNCLKFIKPESQKGPCFPCDCSEDCVCGENKICSCGCNVEDCICGNEDICSCGCGLENCICEIDDICSCGCAMKECICETLNARNECSCGCQLEDCICEQLFSKSCNCGHADCDCGAIQVLNAYLESLNQPLVTGACKNAVKLVSTEMQTGAENESIWVLESTQKEGSYCVICGHFNCNCKLNKTV